MAALAGGISAFVLACTQPAAAQRADQPTAEGTCDLDEIVVTPRPNNVASVELVKRPLGPQSAPATNAGATGTEPKMLITRFEGYIEAGIGNHGQNMTGGAVTIPLVQDKLQLSVEGYQAHTGTR
jgi:hypothetical protein